MRKTSVPQMSLAYIGAVLEREGHNVRLYDCIALEITTDVLIQRCKTDGPGLIVVNTTTPSIQNDMRVVETLKKHISSPIAAFGTHVTAFHSETLNMCPSLDMVVRGEPELIIYNLVKSLDNNEPLSTVKGITYRGDGEIFNNQDEEWISDLDWLGYPARHLLPNDKYKHPVTNKIYTMVNVSRGCPQKCIFCVAHVYYGHKMRYRSIGSILDELENNVIGKFGIDHVWFYADDFTSNRDFVVTLCKEIVDSKLKLKWWSNTRVDALDPEMFKWMKKSGCFMLSIGGESGNQAILERMKKRTQLDQIEKTVKMLRKVGIDSLVYFLIGLPGETKDTILDTLNFAKRIAPDYVEFYPATPYPGTEFYDIAIKEGFIKTHDWSLYECGGKEFVVDIPGVTTEELNEMLQSVYREFYFRPAYIKLLLKKAIRPVEFIRLCQFGLGYFQRFMDKQLSR